MTTDNIDDDFKSETTQELLQNEPASKVTPFVKNRAKRTKSYKKLEKKYFWLRNFSVILLICSLIGILLSVVSLKRVSNQNLRLKNELHQLSQRNENLLSEMQTLRVENDTMMQGRIPGLTPLKFDDPYKLDSQTLKSVVFTQTEYNNRITYEYLAVIQNNTRDVLRPSSRLLFFNKSGLQIGESKIAIAENYSGELKIISLKPGESHSFSGKIQMASTEEPKYFKLIYQK